MAIRHVALRGLVDFSCLGAACEDHCCHDWSIDLDRDRHAAIKRALDGNGADRARFARAVTLAPAHERTRRHFALLTVDGDNACTLLDGKLCTLHARFGEALLPDTCAAYPRVLSAADERHELTGELSCPELARRCLTRADGTELVACAATLAGRATVGQRSGDGDGPYRRYNGAIRGALFRLLERARFSVDERLFFMSCFAHETRAFFNRDTTRLDGARLSEQLRLLEDEAALEGLARHLASLDGAPELIIEALAQLMATWLRQHCAPRFRELVRAALESLVGPSDATMQLDAAAMSRAWLARKAALSPTVAPRLDAIVTRYARHFVIRHWYTDAPDLMSYVQQLLLRVATARLLIYCHPRLASDAQRRADPEAIDAAAVEIFYTLTRALEHSAVSLRAAMETLRDHLPTLAHAIALAKL